MSTQNYKKKIKNIHIHKRKRFVQGHGYFTPDQDGRLGTEVYMWRTKGSGANMGNDGGSWHWRKWRRKNSTGRL